MSNAIAWLIGFVVFVLLMAGWIRAHNGSRKERQRDRERNDDLMWRIAMEKREIERQRLRGGSHDQI